MNARGHHAVSLEAGPTLARTAYGEDCIVDELCLSTYLGTDLTPLSLGGALPDDAVLFGDKSLTVLPIEIEDWLFYRYL